MKLILLIAAILIISLASSKVIEIKKPLARTIAPEDLALELELYSTCQEFKDRILPSVWISKHDLCLPIQFNVTSNPDVDDLRTHYFCTNIEHGKSIVHFVEIYESDETIQFPSFVLSLVPSTPFRVLTKRTTVSRRPNCFITNDYCNSTNAIVNSCKTNPVVYKKGYIVSHDRIYITANQQESRDCRTSVTECCAYVAPLTFGGICENIASTDVLKIPKKNKYDDDKKHHNNHHNDHHDNDHHDNDHHDNDHHDNDHHDNDHHDNDHHDNDHHDNDHDNNHNGHGNQHNNHDNDHNGHGNWNNHDNDHGDNDHNGHGNWNNHDNDHDNDNDHNGHGNWNNHDNDHGDNDHNGHGNWNNHDNDHGDNDHNGHGNWNNHKEAPKKPKEQSNEKEQEENDDEKK